MATPAEIEVKARERIAHYHSSNLDDQAVTDALYADWEATYDQELTSGLNYIGHKVLAEYFQKHASALGLSKDCRILDVAAGTGLAAVELQKVGYYNIDGSDPCGPMLEEARKVNAYKQYLLCGTGDDMQMPIQDGEYDATTICGALTRIKVGGLRDMLRVTKPDLAVTMPTPAELEAQAKERVAHYHNNTLDDQKASDDLYTEWAATYDQEVTSGLNYMGPKVLAEYFHKHASALGLNKDCRILDVGAGTGLAGVELQKLGYANIDGSDPSGPMLEEARKVNAYKQYLVCGTGDDMQMPIQDGEYDATTVCGALPHIKVGGLRDMIRVTKPGGLFMCSGRVTYYTMDATWMMPSLDKLEAEGYVQKLEIATPNVKYYMDKDALVLAYKVLK